MRARARHRTEGPAERGPVPTATVAVVAGVVGVLLVLVVLVLR